MAGTRSRRAADDSVSGAEPSPTKTTRSRHVSPPEAYYDEPPRQRRGQHASVTSENEFSEAPILKPTRPRRARTTSPERSTRANARRRGSSYWSSDSPGLRSPHWDRLHLAYQALRTRRLSEENERRVRGVGDFLFATVKFLVMSVLVVTVIAVFLGWWSGTPEQSPYQISRSISTKRSLQPWLEWLASVPTRGAVSQMVHLIDTFESPPITLGEWKASKHPLNVNEECNEYIKQKIDEKYQCHAYQPKSCPACPPPHESSANRLSDCIKSLMPANFQEAKTEFSRDLAYSLFQTFGAFLAIVGLLVVGSKFIKLVSGFVAPWIKKFGNHLQGRGLPRTRSSESELPSQVPANPIEWSEGASGEETLS